MNDNDIVVFDTETSGLDVGIHDLLSIGWVKLRIVDIEHVNILEKRQLYVKDENIKNVEAAYAINQISDEYRNTVGVDIETVMNEFVNAINGCDVYAYCVSFDVAFVRKYRPNAFDAARKIHDIRIYCECVENAIQRMLYSYNKDFKYTLKLTNHYHDALDDAWAETMLMLHYIFKISVKRWLTVNDVKYEPIFTFGKYKGCRVCDVLKTDKYYVKWFVFIMDMWQYEYLREWFMRRYNDFTIGKVPSLAKRVDIDRYVNVLMGKMNVIDDGPHVEPLIYHRP